MNTLVLQERQTCLSLKNESVLLSMEIGVVDVRS